MNLIVINPGSLKVDATTGRLAAGWVRLHGNTYLSASTPEGLPPGAIVVELNKDHRPMLAHWLDKAAHAVIERAYVYAHIPTTAPKMTMNLTKQLQCVLAATMVEETKRTVEFYLSLGATPEVAPEPPQREPIRLRNRTGSAGMYILGLTAEDRPSTVGDEE